MPSPATLTRSTAPPARVHTNTSRLWLVSPGTRLDAADEKLIAPPSALIPDAAPPLASLPWTPPAETLTRVVCPVARSRSNTSAAPFVSPATRFVASEVKTTKRPSALMRALDEAPFACPPEPSEARVVVPVTRFRTNTSRTPLVSPATRLGEPETKATSVPSAETEIPSWAVDSLADTPPVVTVTSAGGVAASALPALAATSATARPHVSRLDVVRKRNLLRVLHDPGQVTPVGATRKPARPSRSAWVGEADRGTPERGCSCHPPREGYWVSSTVKAVLEVGSYGPGVPMLAELSRFTNTPFTCLPSLFEQ